MTPIRNDPSRVRSPHAHVCHVPREMSRTFWNFIMHGGSVRCEITGRRTLVRCEITRKRTLGKGGGRIHDTNSFDVEK